MQFQRFEVSEWVIVVLDWKNLSAFFFVGKLFGFAKPHYVCVSASQHTMTAHR